MFIVVAKSPFWKSEQFVSVQTTALVYSRGRKQATLFSSQGEAQKVADAAQGGSNRYVASVQAL